MDDGFIRSHIGDLLRSLRTQYLIDLIKPYTRLELSFLAKVCDLTQPKWTTNYSCPMKQLNVDANEVEELLIDLILEGKIDGKIDQVNMRLELDKQYVFRRACANVPSNFATAKVSRDGDTRPSINGLGHSVEFMEPSWGNHRQAMVETHQRRDGIPLVI